MREKYTSEGAPGSAAEAPAGAVRVEELLARLLPGVDAGLLLAGLLAEAARPAGSSELALRDDAEVDPPERELRRVRRQFALGEAARSMQHDLNNPLTALMAEVQLLELETLAAEHRAAARRIVELARRITMVARRLDVSRAPVIG